MGMRCCWSAAGRRAGSRRAVGIFGVWGCPAIWLFGCSAPGCPTHPSGCAEERSSQRKRACDCLSRRRVRARPRWMGAPQVAPEAQRRGTQPVGSPFFGALFFGETKKSASPAGASPGFWPQQKARRLQRPKAYHPRLTTCTKAAFFPPLPTLTPALSLRERGQNQGVADLIEKDLQGHRRWPPSQPSPSGGRSKARHAVRRAAPHRNAMQCNAMHFAIKNIASSAHPVSAEGHFYLGSQPQMLRHEIRILVAPP